MQLTTCRITVLLLLWTTRCPIDLNETKSMPSGPVHPYQKDESISNFKGCLVHFFIFILFRIDIPVSKQ